MCYYIFLTFLFFNDRILNRKEGLFMDYDVEMLKLYFKEKNYSEEKINEFIDKIIKLKNEFVLVEEKKSIGFFSSFF